MKWTMLSLCILTLAHCGDSDIYILEEEVDEEIVGYFRSFAFEAALRGRTIDWDLERIATEFIDSETDAIGSCLTYDDGSNLITIDKTNWDISSDVEREFLIFHELGHCLLERSHTNTSNLRGVCASIMNSGENICFLNYNTNTRNDYLNELFL